MNDMMFDELLNRNESIADSPSPNLEHVPPPWPKGTFEILYVDPPWDYKGQLQHNGKGGRDTGGAEKHYPTMKLNELMQLPVPRISADNSLLFMWTSSPHLDQAIKLGLAWGFNWATVAFVWDKMKTNPGFYTLSRCELCLLFKRGKIPQPRGARNIRQLIQEERGRHSAKPIEAKKRIDAMFPNQRKIELFARNNHGDDWHYWGLEANGA